MTSPAIVEVEGVRKDYVGPLPRRRRHTALSDVSFSVPRGSVCALLGPNGAGKSTTIHLLLGFIKPSAGSIRIDAEAPESPRSRRSLGFLAEIFAFDRFLTGRALLEQFDALSGRDAPRRGERVDDALRLVGLESDAHRKVGTYSKGMTQRIGLAQALLGDPELLILDEPMSGMDPASRRAVKGILRDRRSRGRTTLLSSHILADIEELADHVLILSRGRVLADAPLHELRGTTAAQRVVFQRPWPPVEDPGFLSVAARSTSSGDGSEMDLTCAEEELNDVLRILIEARCRIVSVNPTHEDLESFFLDLTGR